MSKEMMMSTQTTPARTSLRSRALGAWLLAGLLGLTALGFQAASAAASMGIESFDVTSTSHRAGSHPDLGMTFALESPGDPEAAQNVIVNTPEGIFGNPNATTQCTSEDFALDQCPPASQVGTITIVAKHGGEDEKLLGTAPIFGVHASNDETALFAFIVPTLNIPVSIPVEVRTAGDYGLRFTVSQLTQLAPLKSADITFWGFPAHEDNDDERFPKGSPGAPAGCPASADTSCITSPTPAAATVRPLINYPVKCTGADIVARLTVETYQDPTHPTTATATYPPVTDCFDMIFKPVLYANPTTKAADSASGLDLRLSAPQPLGEATTPSPIRAAQVTLPPGFTINPDAADGQSSCPDALANFNSEAAAACPDNSKIGTFSIGTPALDGRLHGAIFIGEPKPGDQYRLILTVDGFGIHGKFLGSFLPDPATGQLTAVMDNLPQVPFDDFQLHLFASDRGLLATPGRCGVFETRAHFFPWNDALADQRSAQLFSIETGPGGGPCPGVTRPFSPTLAAGTTDPTAGGFSDFSLKLDRNDGDQYLGDLNFTMPPGFTGSLRGITYCPEGDISAAALKPGLAERSSPSCPPSSEIGTTNVAAGPGAYPFNAVGKIYMAGPFKGAPLSLVAVTPALAGPYDYGTQVVRVAVHIDPTDAHVIAVSDTVPSIIGGVPLRLRSIRVSLDRPRFIINPTNCKPMTVHSEGIGDEGTVAGFDSYFHAVNCFALGFKPKMTIRQMGKATKRSQNPALQIDLRTRPGDANIKSLSVTLPTAFAIDQRHLGNICSEKELVESQCKGRTAIGKASTRTPLLDRPLEGPVYAVSGSGGLPRLAFILNGQVNLVPRAQTKSLTRRGTGRLHTTVPVVPDAAIGHFRMTIFGGKQGYLVNTRSLCGKTPRVQVAFKAQNGRSLKRTIKLRAGCNGKKKKKKQAR
jgi:hypothetical protein